MFPQSINTSSLPYRFGFHNLESASVSVMQQSEPMLKESYPCRAKPLQVNPPNTAEDSLLDRSDQGFRDRFTPGSP